MSPEGAQLRFAVEFATFLVAVAGAAIVLLRPHLVGANRRSRVVLALGFAGSSVHPHPAPLVILQVGRRLASRRGNGIGEHLADGAVQPVDLLGGEF